MLKIINNINIINNIINNNKTNRWLYGLVPLLDTSVSCILLNVLCKSPIILICSAGFKHWPWLFDPKDKKKKEGISGVQFTTYTN